MALVGTDSRWLQVNRALCQLVGYPEEELLATTLQAITRPDDLDTDLGYVNQMLHGEIPTYQNGETVCSHARPRRLDSAQRIARARPGRKTALIHFHFLDPRHHRTLAGIGTTPGSTWSAA